MACSTLSRGQNLNRRRKLGLGKVQAQIFICMHAIYMYISICLGSEGCEVGAHSLGVNILYIYVSISYENLTLDSVFDVESIGEDPRAPRAHREAALRKVTYLSGRGSIC